MTCTRASEIDLLGFLQEPRSAAFDEFREHYPGCRDCAREVAAWTELEARLHTLGDASAHPSPSELDAFEARGPLAPDVRRRIETHLEGCAPCRDELRALRAFAPAADAAALAMAEPHAAAAAAPAPDGRPPDAPAPRGRPRWIDWIRSPALAWGVAALLAVPLVYRALPGIDAPAREAARTPAAQAPAAAGDAAEADALAQRDAPEAVEPPEEETLHALGYTVETKEEGRLAEAAPPAAPRAAAPEPSPANAQRRQTSANAPPREEPQARAKLRALEPEPEAAVGRLRATPQTAIGPGATAIGPGATAIGPGATAIGPGATAGDAGAAARADTDDLADAALDLERGARSGFAAEPLATESLAADSLAAASPAPPELALRLDAAPEISTARAAGPLRVRAPDAPGAATLRVGDAVVLSPEPGSPGTFALPPGTLRPGENRLELSAPDADEPLVYRVIVR